MRASIIAASAAALLLATGATAQEGSLSEQEVQDFLNPLAEKAETAVGQGDWQSIESWFREHLSEDATFAIDGSLLVTNGPAMTYQVVLTHRDLQAMGERAGGANPSQSFFGQGRIEDYRVDLEVLKVLELPDGRASAAVVFYETGMLRPPGEGDQAAAGGAVFSSISRCDLRLARSGTAVQIELAGCQVSTTL